jgi:hypothetical protein
MSFYKIMISIVERAAKDLHSINNEYVQSLKKFVQGTYIYTYIYIYIYIYVYRERERDIPIYSYIYIYCIIVGLRNGPDNFEFVSMHIYQNES